MAGWASSSGASNSIRLLNDFFWANQTNAYDPQNDNTRDLVPPYFEEVLDTAPSTGKYWNFNDFWVGGHGVYDYEYVPLPGEERAGRTKRRLNQEAPAVQYNLNNCARTTNGQFNYLGCMGVCQPALPHCSAARVRGVIRCLQRAGIHLPLHAD